MTAINKHTAKIALIDFCKDEKNHFWQKKFFNISLKWHCIGNVKDYQVLHFSVPWQEKEFVKFNLEKQRQMLLRILKNAHKSGCVAAGLPMKWRMILSGNNLLDIPNARELALDKAVYDLAAKVRGLAGKNISVLGVDDRFAKSVSDRILSEGGKLILSGVKARSLSEWYYRNQGLAVPVFRTEKAGEAADGMMSLTGAALHKYESKTVVYGDVPVKLKGDWQPPFADGKFPCGLAAVLLSAGAESESGFEKKKERTGAAKQAV
ncbi:MAG: hypothetical protein ACOX7J_04470 [Bacillota bacterium]